MAEVCETCRYWMRAGQDLDGGAHPDCPVGLCRRYAPHVAVREQQHWPLPPAQPPPADRWGVRALWPITDDLDWCGEWQRIDR